jgi:hypothetical protein
MEEFSCDVAVKEGTANTFIYKDPEFISIELSQVVLVPPGQFIKVSRSYM